MNTRILIEALELMIDDLENNGEILGTDSARILIMTKAIAEAEADIFTLTGMDIGDPEPTTNTITPSPLRDRYDIYTANAPLPHKTFDEWMDT
jgi:hypothetical protein